MLVLIERYPEVEKLKKLTSNGIYSTAVKKLESNHCPLLVDLENGILKLVDIDYTGESYNLVFR